MHSFVLLYLLAIFCVVSSKSLEGSIVDDKIQGESPGVFNAGLCKRPMKCKYTKNYLDAQMDLSPAHRLWKRFVNSSMTFGSNDGNAVVKMRTRRSAEECEKLELCKLHARASRNFISAFELYFVNKENARLWDHRVHSMSDCEHRFHCYDDYE